MNSPLPTVERLEVRANWTAHRISFLAFTQRVVELIRQLRLVSPALRDWAIMTNEEPWFVVWDGEADSLLDPLIATNFSESKIDCEAARAKPDKLFNATAFRAHLACTSAGGGPTDTPEEGGLVLDISCGSTPLMTAGKRLWTPQNWIEAERVRSRSLAEVSLKLPANRVGRLHEPAMVLELIDALVRTWDPSRCSVDSFEFLKQAYGLRPFGREQRATGGKRKLWQGWITYLRLPGLASLLSGADVDVEPLGADGCLIFTDRQRVDATESRHVLAAQAIDALLTDLCINQDHVLVDGWPVDPRDAEYARQCGATPQMPKPRVGLSVFTVRDDARQVLIFSSLFRSEALDDLLYSPQSFNQSIDSMRPVAEARKQLRSLTLAGSTDVIEWHIGRAELVAPLRQLFQQAGIDEARLRVMSTPYLA